MPPHTKEKKHYHQYAQQFFRIISGTAVFELEDATVTVKSGEGIHIPPMVKHQIRNEQTENLVFIVISEPSTRGDRYDEAQN